MNNECKECSGENYVLIGCCNGRECGCMGQPVAVTNCKQCNPSGLEPMGDYVSEYDMIEYVGD